MKLIEDIRRAFANDQISREQFWLDMQGRHLSLREHQALLADGELDTIEISAGELRVVTRAGVKMVWDPEDLRTAPNILVNSGVYEPVESRALSRAADGARVIFDIGANIGFFSLHWAKLVAAGGSVHSFEPVPTTYARLARNVELNGLGGVVRTNNEGLGDVPSTLTFYLPGFSGSGAASMKDLHPDEESIEVEARVGTLDDYFARAALDGLDLVKIDVEGAELLVLKGGMETIGEHRPILFLELLRKWSKPFGYHPNDVIALLGRLGYGCYTHEEGRLVRFASMTDESVQTNFFFADPDRHSGWLAANEVETLSRIRPPSGRSPR